MVSVAPVCGFDVQMQNTVGVIISKLVSSSEGIDSTREMGKPVLGVVVEALRVDRRSSAWDGEVVGFSRDLRKAGTEGVASTFDEIGGEQGDEASFLSVIA